MNFSANNFTHQPRHVETTQFEDILVEKGIISERKELTAEREAREEVRKRTEQEEPDAAVELTSKSLQELDLVEDDYEHEVLSEIRAQRIRELKKKQKEERFGEVYPIIKADFVKEVTEASQEVWVVVEMFKSGIRESGRASELMREVAKRHPETKFVRIRSTDCVEGWPDSSVPCFFLYREKMQKQLIGLDFCGGVELATSRSMEYALANFGVFKTDITDPFKDDETEKEIEREQRESQEADRKAVYRSGLKGSNLPGGVKRTSKGAVLESLSDDDDDDW